VIYLLDVNVLLALVYTMHVHYERAWCWLAEQRERQAPSTVKLATCATTELGFIRVASGPARLAASVADARADLEMLKLRERMMFVSDRVIGERLPDWVTKSAQTTDGHLVVVAKANGARLVTLDRFIPDAEFIPNSDGSGGAPLNLEMHCRCSA
jgi:predicted nucleic acid-binding protein